MNELTETGSQPMTAVGDVVDDLQLVARDATQMAASQAALAEWFRAKVELTEKDAAEDELAGVWYRLRTKTPLFGYPDVDEAVDALTKFLGAK